MLEAQPESKTTQKHNTRKMFNQFDPGQIKSN